MERKVWLGLAAIVTASFLASGVAFWLSWRSMQSERRQAASSLPISSTAMAPRPSKDLGSVPKGSSLTGVSTRQGPLALKLLGILTRQQAGESIAVIRDLDRSTTGLYRIGERLPHGATLLTISPGQVTVRRSDGTAAVLSLEAADGTIGEMARGIVTPLSPKERLIDQEALQKAAVPLLMELSQVKIHPSVEEGRLIGFGVQGVSSEGILKALGVEEGDVISAVNGRSLENYREATELLGEAIHHPPFKMTLNKKDRKETLTYHLAQ